MNQIVKIVKVDSRAKEHALRYLYALLFCLSGCTTTNIKTPDFQYGNTSDWQAIRWGGVVKQDLDFFVD